MKIKRIYSNQEYHPGYGAGDGNIERYEYECLRERKNYRGT